MAGSAGIPGSVGVLARMSAQRERCSSPAVREAVLVRGSGRLNVAQAFKPGITVIFKEFEPALAGDRILPFLPTAIYHRTDVSSITNSAPRI